MEDIEDEGTARDDSSEKIVRQLVARLRNASNFENIDSVNSYGESRSLANDEDEASPIAFRHSRISKPISRARTRIVAVFPAPEGPVKANIFWEHQMSN
jgi:hypothetical protein